MVETISDINNQSDSFRLNRFPELKTGGNDFRKNGISNEILIINISCGSLVYSSMNGKNVNSNVYILRFY